MIKWSKIELVRAITSTFMHGYAPNFEEVEEAYLFGPVRPFVCPSIRLSVTRFACCNISEPLELAT